MKTNGNDSINPTSTFEVHRIHGQDNDVSMMKGGLTKREYFAALAMQGEIASQSESLGLYCTDEGYKMLAEKSVKCADALIKALNEKADK